MERDSGRHSSKARTAVPAGDIGTYAGGSRTSSGERRWTTGGGGGEGDTSGAGRGVDAALVPAPHTRGQGSLHSGGGRKPQTARCETERARPHTGVLMNPPVSTNYRALHPLRPHYDHTTTTTSC